MRKLTQEFLPMLSRPSKMFVISLLLILTFSQYFYLITIISKGRPCYWINLTVYFTNALVEAMNEDQDTDMIQLRQRNDISIPIFFALVPKKVELLHIEKIGGHKTR